MFCGESDDEPVLIPVANTGGPSAFALSPEAIARHCKDIVRNLYKKPPNAPHYSPEQLKHLYDSMHQMKVYRHNKESTTEIPHPFMTFYEAFPDNAAILEALKKQRFTKPTPIQSQLWPTLLKGNDCIGISPTGSGKTLGFLLPAFLHIDAQLRLYQHSEKKPCPFVLILTPTRELAQQITIETEKYSYNGYRSVCVYGGADRYEQINACRRGVEIVVATPGRLVDLADEGCISLATVSYLVLDEADRMLDIGFELSIRRILCEIRPDRMVTMTSATWPENVRKLVEKYTKDAVMIVVGSLNLTVCPSVKQYFEFWDDAEKKFDRLLEIARFLRDRYGNRFIMIVFVKSKAMADFIAVELCLELRISTETMHGGMSQLARDNAFERVRAGEVRILVATDVVGRGIDIPDVT
ncbi:DEAD/DEAH box helicase [Oesophagostomum dentatum]|uniref:RNA helicase n=1 Tax=Oesophagostomum dentatum TaxID=61180 RepID=A0A0B1TR48_OESDE|nr:DEAD/DEAH box helicase [Oesophagostomum dentatum]